MSTRQWVVLIILVLAGAGAGAYFFLLNQPAQEEELPGQGGPVAPAPPKELTQAEKKDLAERKCEELKDLAAVAKPDLIAMEVKLKEIRELKQRGALTKAEAVYNTAAGKHKDEAGEAYDELAAKINKRFKAVIDAPAAGPLIKKDQYVRLLSLFEEYPGRFAASEYADKLRNLKEPIRKAIDACQAYEDVREAAVRFTFDKNYEGAIAQLNKFPERFKDSEWESARQKLLTDYQTALAGQTAEKKKEQLLTYYDLYHGQELEKADWDAEGNWKLKDGVLIGESADGSESFAYNYGKDWVDIVLRMRMRLVRGSVTLGVRGTEISEGHFTFDPIRISIGELEANKWYTLTIKLRGKNYTVTGDPQLRRPVEDWAKKSRGPFCFFLNAESEIHIKWVKVGFFDKIPASFVNEATKQQADGRAEKPDDEEEKEE